MMHICLADQTRKTVSVTTLCSQAVPPAEAVLKQPGTSHGLCPACILAAWDRKIEPR